MTPPLTVVEAADRLNVSVHTIRAWIRERRIGHTRLGRCVRITEAQLNEFVERGWVPAKRDIDGKSLR